MGVAGDVIICARRKVAKAANEFNWRRREKGQRDTYCRPCRSEYGKEHYAANRSRYIEQARIQKERLRLERTSYLLEYFKSHPCVDCGEADPVVLDFDHLRDKLFDISAALIQKRRVAVLAEIEKCEVVCSNFHRRRTARRRGALRAILSQGT